jgi:hypothetical protein
LQDAPGTMIGNFRVDPDAPAGHFVKGFATIDDVSLINVEVLRPSARSSALSSALPVAAL